MTKASSSRLLPVKKAADWLCRSGIQNLSRNPKLRGGVASWYEIDAKIYPFLYSEITGYALSTHLFLCRVRSDPKMLRSAHLGAGWLLRNALHADGGLKTRYYLVKHYVSPNYCFYQGRIYAFDTAMAGYGLLQLHKAEPCEEYDEAIRRIASFLLHKMRKKDGSFYPYYDSSARRCDEDLEKWSDQGGTFHAKLALFLIDYHRLTGIPSYRQAATELLDGVASAQEKDGRFITGKKDVSTHLHPHAYTLEGLLYGAHHLKRKDYLKAARKGFEWMLRGVSDDGSVSSIYQHGSFSHHERSDIVAQALRLGSVLYAMDSSSVSAHLPRLEKIRSHLLLFQHGSGTRQAGGFVYGAATDGLMRVHLNAWSTMFALQALWMHDAFVRRRRPFWLESFV